MKIYVIMCVFLMLALSCSSILFGQKIKNRNDNHLALPVKKTIITGCLSKYEVKDLFIISIANIGIFNDRSDPQGAGFYRNDSCKIINGQFKFEFLIDHPVYIVIPGITSRKGNVFWGGLLIEPGDSIYIDKTHSSTFAQAEASFYSGNGSEKLSCIQQIFKNSELFRSPIDLSESGNLNEIIRLSDSINTMIAGIINIYKHRLSPVAISIIKGQFIPSFCGDISSMILKRKIDVREIKNKDIIRKQLFKLNSQINPSDSNLIYCIGIQQYLINHALLKYCTDNNKDYWSVVYSLEGKKEYFQAIKDFIPNRSLREKVLAYYLEDRLLNIPLNTDLSKCIAEFLLETKEMNTFHRGIKKLKEIYSDRLKKGMPAYNFLISDTVGRVYQMRDFKDKVVLIDFMFTGCLGCAQIVPSLKKVEEKFKDRDDIAFLTVSIDKKNDWRGTTTPSSVPGTLFLYTNGSNHPMIKFYNITNFPSLLLIDKKGKIVSIAAPNPRIDNGEALITLIETLIRK